MKDFLISIVCPLYNKENYIQETIKSVLAQEYLNWELIIVDDKSTDRSLSIALEYSIKYPNIKVYERSEYGSLKGGASCRNLGVRLSNGEYIMFLDADDTLSPNCLLSRYRMASKNRKKNFLIFNHAYFYKNVQMPFIKLFDYKISKFLFELSCNKKAHLLKKFLKCDFPFTISNVLWEKNFFLEIGGFDPSFSRLQDPQLHTKALLSSKLNLLCLKYKSSPDVLIRLDPERHSNSELKNEVDKFKSFIENSLKYITETTTLLDSVGLDRFKHHLNGFFFSAEMRYFNLRKQVLLDEEQNEISQSLLKLKSIRNKIALNETYLFNFKVNILKCLWTSNNKSRSNIGILVNFIINKF